MLGVRFCARAFSSCRERGPLFIAVRGPLTIVVSLVAEHRLQTRRLSSCGSRAQLLRGMWDLPRPGLEPVSPALAGGFSTTAPPGKPWEAVLICNPGSELQIRGFWAQHSMFILTLHFLRKWTFVYCAVQTRCWLLLCVEPIKTLLHLNFTKILSLP